MIIEIIVDGVVLPSPTTISINSEIIWSAETGRTLSGLMVGDVVANKDTMSIEWNWLTSKEYGIISGCIHSTKFFNVVVEAIGIDIMAYRGAVTRVLKSVANEIYYSTASVDFVQR